VSELHYVHHLSYHTFSISYNKCKGKGEVVSVNTMKEHGGEEVQLHSYLIFTLDWG